jgi:acyl dehydratase/NAD(P)-dependent dehydrogenase (short-subunit alcohol dehydrogenase family)
MRATVTRFTPADQRSFARRSGDYNPIHLDAAAARRVVAGEPIVHGVHLLLRMLEAYFGATRMKPRQGVSVSIAFLQPVIVGERIRLTRDAEGRVSAETIDGGVTLAVATIASIDAVPAGRGFQPRLGGPERAAPRRPHRTPLVRTAADIDGAAGAIAPPPAAPVARAFPRAARALGAEAVAAVAGLSALVGMECPGRDSLLSSIRVELRPRDRSKRLDWAVERVDRRFGLVKIAVHGTGVAGSIDAFVRPRPAAPPTIAGASTRVAPGELAAVRALIVGGSRGLGAATATLIAAGGGTSIVTYASGGDEAAVLRRDAKAAGRAIDALRLDVRARDASRIIRDAVARFGITQLYYFASPRIFVRRSGPFDERLFDRFATFYVYAFARLSAAALAAAPSLAIFYPSTTAIDDVPAELTEYATAKAAGECVCRGIAEQHPRNPIVWRRLPRIATDQTASILGAPALDPLDAMLPIVREIQQRAGGSLA